MEGQRVEELFSEILRRLDYFESQVQNPNGSIALTRHLSLERYRREYLRQIGHSPDAMLPTNPEGEDEID
jgi:hypothetical protein